MLSIIINITSLHYVEIQCQQKGKNKPSGNTTKPDQVYKNHNWFGTKLINWGSSR